MLERSGATSPAMGEPNTGGSLRRQASLTAWKERCRVGCAAGESPEKPDQSAARRADVPRALWVSGCAAIPERSGKGASPKRKQVKLLIGKKLDRQICQKYGLPSV